MDGEVVGFELMLMCWSVRLWISCLMMWIVWLVGSWCFSSVVWLSARVVVSNLPCELCSVLW